MGQGNTTTRMLAVWTVPSAFWIVTVGWHTQSSGGSHAVSMSRSAPRITVKSGNAEDEPAAVMVSGSAARKSRCTVPVLCTVAVTCTGPPVANAGAARPLSVVVSVVGPGTVTNIGIEIPRLIFTFAVVCAAGTRKMIATWWSPTSGAGGTATEAVTTCVPPEGVTKLVGAIVTHVEAE